MWKMNEMHLDAGPASELRYHPAAGREMHALACASSRVNQYSPVTPSLFVCESLQIECQLVFPSEDSSHL